MSEHNMGTKFGDMSFTGKMKWIGKLIIALCTAGFVYPNIMTD